MPLATDVSLPPLSVTVVHEPGKASQVPVFSGASSRSTIAVEASRPEAESLPFFLSGRLYDDGIIDPRDTRTVLGLALSACANAPLEEVGYGVFRM